MMVFSYKPPRARVDHAAYFLTLLTFRRQRILLLPKVAPILLYDLGYYARKVQSLLSYTIQPDHMHLLVEVQRSEEVSNFLRDFKKHSSRLIGLLGVSVEEHVWLRGTMDHWTRPGAGGRDFENHMRYIYANCWRHQGILPREYPYHNFWEAVRRGWLDPGFCDPHWREGCGRGDGGTAR
jgi:REP element-mobilizing transposase RayT